MFTVTKKSADRVDIAISGPIDADMMKSALDDLVAATKDMRGGKMLYTITDFALPSFSALRVEMTYLPHLWGMLAAFDKCAVLTDTKWLRDAASVKGALLPGFEIKAFELIEAEQAEAWLAAQD